MNKLSLEKKNQKIFEEQIELLILYKKLNPKSNVYLNKKCLDKSLKWYTGFMQDTSKLNLDK
tara:strand:+ start:586 stop:771 length:186 start_codon:yes stop_codon:yes gene_type:complete